MVMAQMLGFERRREKAIRRALAFLGVVPLLLAVLAGAVSASQNSKDDWQAEAGSAALKVCLRMEDGSAFVGVSNVRMIPREGRELTGAPSEADGETIFAPVLPGTYTVEASAPGFLVVRRKAQIESGNRHQTLFLIMKPSSQQASSMEAPVPAAAPAIRTNPNQALWIRPGIDEAVPNVEAGVECPLSRVVSGAGRQIKELVENLQKFDATEHVEHLAWDKRDPGGRPEVRTFDYVVIIKVSARGVFQLEEYRNGSADPTRFPDRIATLGLPGMAFAFHPALVSQFDLSCEGLGQWDGHAAWQVHFAQRPDRPNTLSGYVINHQSHPIPLKGRVWIDAGTLQIRHLETELMSPIRELDLTQERIAIDYGLVQFRTHTEQLWLPIAAEIYWEVHGRHIYRRHSFSNFKVFEVESVQQIQARESYCFTNRSDHEIAGILAVSPATGTSAPPASIQFGIPPGASVCKLVGSGKDVDIPIDEVGSATFRHNGPADSIKADANLVKESTLDLVPESDIAELKP